MGFCSTAHLVQDRQRPAALVRVFGGSQPIMMVICHLAWVVPHCYGPSTSLPGRLISVHEVLCVRGINKQLRDEISYPILAIFFFPLCVCFPIMTGIGTDRCCSQVLPPMPASQPIICSPRPANIGSSRMASTTSLDERGKCLMRVVYYASYLYEQYYRRSR